MHLVAQTNTMRWLLFTLFIAATIAAFSWFAKTGNQPSLNKIVPAIAAGKRLPYDLQRLKTHSHQIKIFAAQKEYNSRYCFLVDMKQPSGSKRFFVYDLKNDSVVNAGLVTHGYGGAGEETHFSNVSGSNCTSLGKYKIGNAYNGRFGLAYKLHGLDATNSNAFNRFVVLHSHECVPDVVSDRPICQSQGCPTVSPLFLKTLQQYLDKTQQPMLLYIFN